MKNEQTTWIWSRTGYFCLMKESHQILLLALIFNKFSKAHGRIFFFRNRSQNMLSAEENNRNSLNVFHSVCDCDMWFSLFVAEVKNFFNKRHFPHRIHVRKRSQISSHLCSKKDNICILHTAVERYTKCAAAFLSIFHFSNIQTDTDTQIHNYAFQKSRLYVCASHSINSE